MSKSQKTNRPTTDHAAIALDLIDAALADYEESIRQAVVR